MTILNMAGSEVRRWNGVVSQLLIDDLHPGIYTLKIVFRGTGMAQAHKLILL